MTNEKQRYKEIGDFLKSKRAKITPEMAGITSGARRRTPGLRREEVAQLAGIGLTWYTWLEQGRSIHVSNAVIESLSRVLMLNKHERSYLYQLAQQVEPAQIPDNCGNVSKSIWHLLNSLTTSPSMVMDSYWSVIAWNNAACAIFGDFNKMSFRERNVVWAMFNDKKYKSLMVDWESHAKDLVGKFRSACGAYIEDGELKEFVDELKQNSTEFNLWWSLHEIINVNDIYKKLNHPEAGVLEFEVNKFIIPDEPGMMLVVHTPTPDTKTQEKMRMLINL